LNFHPCFHLVVVCDHFHSYSWVSHLISSLFKVKVKVKEGQEDRRKEKDLKERKKMGEEKGIVSKK